MFRKTVEAGTDDDAREGVKCGDLVVHLDAFRIKVTRVVGVMAARRAGGGLEGAHNTALVFGEGGGESEVRAGKRLANPKDRLGERGAGVVAERTEGEFFGQERTTRSREVHSAAALGEDSKAFCENSGDRRRLARRTSCSRGGNGEGDSSRLRNLHDRLRRCDSSMDGGWRRRRDSSRGGGGDHGRSEVNRQRGRNREVFEELVSTELDGTRRVASTIASDKKALRQAAASGHPKNGLGGAASGAARKKRSRSSRRRRRRHRRNRRRRVRRD